MMCHAGFGGVDPEPATTLFLETFGGGYGGRFGSDGPDAVQTHGQTPRTRRSRSRAELPGARRAALARRGLGRPGRFRGGLGLRKDFLFIADDLHRACRPTLRAGGRVRRRARQGGGVRPDPRRSETRLAAKTTIELEPGDVVSYRTCGGGGYGPPPSATPSSSPATCARAR